MLEKTVCLSFSFAKRHEKKLKIFQQSKFLKIYSLGQILLTKGISKV